MVNLRASLRKSEVVAARGERSPLVFQQDYEFNSPSLAAAFIRGAATNGRVEWKDAQGRTLKTLQEQGIPATAHN